MAKKNLMSEVATYLATRPDVQIVATGEGTNGQRIVATQLRRIWHKKVWDSAVFSRHEKEMWHYYGQTVVIEEADVDKHGELCVAQRELAKGLARAGVDAILAQTLGYVVERLGAVPGDWGQWEKRVEK